MAGVGTNRYAYAGNDPVNKSDPNGHSTGSLELAFRDAGNDLGGNCGGWCGGSSGSGAKGSSQNSNGKNSGELSSRAGSTSAITTHSSGTPKRPLADRPRRIACNCDSDDDGTTDDVDPDTFGAFQDPLPFLGPSRITDSDGNLDPLPNGGGISPHRGGSLPPASAPTGTRGILELKTAPFQRNRNTAGTVDGREYSGHAFDQMQDRGLTPRVIENAIRNGQQSGTRDPDTTRFYDSVNNVTVFVDRSSGRVITTRGGQ